MRRYVVGIEVMRVFGVLLVLITALQPFLHTYLPAFLADLLGLLGAGIFIFASGLSLSEKYPTIGTRSELLRYYRHHATHRFPLYWAFIGSAILFTSALMLDEGQMVAYLSGTQTFISGDVLWMAGLVILFYASYPAIIWRTKAPSTIVLRSMFLAMALIGLGVQIGSVHPMLYLFFPTFLAALLLGRCEEFTNIGSEPMTVGLASGFLATCLMYFYLRPPIDIEGPLPGALLSIALITTMVLLACMGILEWFVKKDRNPSGIAIKIGEGAFMAYLCHVTLFTVVFRTIGPLEMEPWIGDMIMLVNLAMTFVIGVATIKFVDIASGVRSRLKARIAPASFVRPLWDMLVLPRRMRR